MKRILYSVAIAVLLMLTQSSFSGTYGGGAGTIEDPYVISTVDHILELTVYHLDWGYHYIMTDDIDLSTGMGTPRIGHYSFPFNGIFDGNGHIIRNLESGHSVKQDHIALFGRIGQNAEVKNLGVENVRISCVKSSKFTGGLAGLNEGTIKNCYVTGSVRGAQYTGLLVGSNSGAISDCFAVGSVDSFTDVGGLVGGSGGTITDCYVIGSVKGGYQVGGLVGFNNGATTYCYSSCVVEGDTKVGGFAGENYYRDGSFSNCLWNRDLNPSLDSIGEADDSSGVIGVTTVEMQNRDTFTDEDWDFVGESVNGNEDIWFIPVCGSPGLVWQSSGTVPDVSGLSLDEAEGIIKVSGSVSYIQKVHSKTVPEGYVISQSPLPECEGTVVSLVVSDGFPYQAGKGTAEEPYHIRTAEQMNSIGMYPQDWDTHFVLMADVDLSEYTDMSYNIIGIDSKDSFSGVFDGNGHIINNLTIHRDMMRIYNVGLFGYFGETGKVKNLGLVNVSISGNSFSPVGGLIGVNYGTVSNCYAIGNLSGYKSVGGLVGSNVGIILDCYTSTNVSPGGSGEHIGGFAGSNYGTISNCHANGNTHGFRYIGGLVGGNYGILEKSHSSVTVTGSRSIGGLAGRNYSGTITDCFANYVVSGNETIGGLTGYNTGTIRNCYSKGRLIRGEPAGGLSGGNSGDIEYCYSFGVVSGEDHVGGFVGANGGLISNSFSQANVSGANSIGGFVGNNGGKVINCYTETSVVGVNKVGGFVGNNRETITNCYTIGTIEGDSSVGGFAGGGNGGVFNSSFWNSEDNPFLTGIGNMDDPAGVQGRTSLELKDLATFTEYGWDFYGESLNGNEDNWYMPRCGYPVLLRNGVGEVPNVTGMLASDAESLITSAGAIVDINIIHSKTVPAGYVISQKPSPGCEASVVTVVVSDGFPYEMGSGSETDPYQIWTGEQMVAIGKHPSDWDSHYILMSDINLSAFAGTSYDVIGNSNDWFTGTFDGNAYSISNFTCTFSEGSNIGLFGYVDYSCEIRDLGLVNVNVKVNSEAGNFVGGLVGLSCGSIINCYVTGSISGHNHVGGMAGNNYNGNITSSYTKCNVNGNESIGGLCGSNGGEITDCYSNSSVIGGVYPGGLAGKNGRIISQSYFAGDVSGSSGGGIAGYNYRGKVTNCYSLGNISGINSGGLVGFSKKGTITNCYSIANVNSSHIIGGSLVGIEYEGVRDRTHYNNVFWNIDTNPGISAIGNIAESSGIIAKTSSEMQLQGTYTSYGWDFVGEDINGVEDIWYMANCGFPLLSWQSIFQVPNVIGLSEAEGVTAITSSGSIAIIQIVHSKVVPSGNVISQQPSAGCEAAVVTITVSDGFPYGAGSGTEADPYQIWTVDQMNSIGKHPDDWSDHFVLMADIDMSAYSDASYNIIGVDVLHSFRGVFDGNSHAISNFTYSSLEDSYIGLFGYVNATGVIRDLEISDIIIETGTGDWISGLAGYTMGDITNCNASGSINSVGRYVGMLSGENTGSITNSVSSGNISGVRNAGGLVGGCRNGRIAYCYSTCNMSGGINIGGLIGAITSTTVEECYSTGTVSGNGTGGGLVGSHQYGVIRDCYSIGDVSCYSKAGGLTGFNFSGVIINCYAAGRVTGNDHVGGLTGGNTRGNYHGSLWNIEVNQDISGVGGISDPEGVMGMDALKMMTQYTYTNYGWDLVGESANGAEDIWWMYERRMYPRLWWEDKDPMEFLEFLTQDVVALELPHGIKNSLLAKLETVIQNLEDGNENNDVAAINVLGAFINAVEAQRGKKIFQDDADALIGNAEQIIDILSYEDAADDVQISAYDMEKNTLDLDGVLMLIFDNWLEVDCGECNGADVFDDNRIDLKDFAVISSQWFE